MEIKTSKLSDEDISMIDRINDTEHVLTDQYMPEKLRDAFVRGGERTAVITTQKEYSFHELGRDVSRTAAYFLQQGIGTGCTVALMFRKSYEQLAAALSVIYSGAAYTPIEYDLPKERIAESLATSHAVLLVTDAQNKAKLLEQGGFDGIEIITWDEAKVDAEAAPAIVDPEDTFAVIFTSGSTGKPKGVMVSFENIRNCFEYTTFRMHVTEQTRIISVINFCHDMNIYELFGVIAENGTVVIPDTEKEREPAHWIELINRYQVNMWESVPTLISLLLLEADKNQDVMPSLKQIILGGEFVPIETVRKIMVHCPNAVTTTIGGPTETTIWNIMHQVEAEDLNKSTIPYGNPIWNTEYYILDDALNVVPIGTTGIIYNAGKSVTKGYTEASLTKEKFIYHPVLKKRLYNTGDLGRYSEKGYIEILGRNDTQVKINGKRIELEGIENRILENPNVKQAAVVANAGHMVAFCSLNEKMLSEKNVDNWSQVFNETYETYHDDSVNENEDFSGWFSSYTHQPIPIEEMQSWRDNTVSRINAIKGKRIFEIGCGTGLLLHKLAPEAERYIGIDISDVAIRNLRKEIAQRGITGTEVYCGAADKLEPYRNMRFDTIIINSVIFFFTDAEYLLNVIRSCAELLEDGGCLLIGDVIDNDLAEIFQSSIVLYNRGAYSDEELRERIRERIRTIKDLLVSNVFFKDVTKTVPEFNRVRICAKENAYNNELTKFRYDVFLFKNQQVSKHETISLDAQCDEISEEQVQRILKSGKNLLIRNAVNKSIVTDYRNLCKLFGRESGITDAEAKTAHMPLYYYTLAQKAGLECAVETRPDGRMDIQIGKDIYSATEYANTIDVESDIYTNVPYKENLHLDMAKQIRETLAMKLPAYMIPEEIVVMEELPFLQNGKINRKELSKLAGKKSSDLKTCQFDGDIAQFIEQLYKKLLKTEQVDPNESFFVIGGHSLLAMQLLNKVMQETHVNIRLSEFMRHPTMEQLIAMVTERYGQNEEEAFDSMEGLYQDDVAHRYDPFPLNDMQRSYYYGRNSIRLGGVATAMFMEFDASDLDMDAFEKTVNKLVERHEMLRCVICEDGMQRILASPDWVKVMAEDYHTVTEQSVMDSLSDTVCDEIFNHMIDLSVFPAFRIRVLQFAEQKYRVFVTVDSTFVDGASLSILIEDFRRLYHHMELKDLMVNFRDYCAACEKKTETKAYQKIAEYWSAREDTLPLAPAIPVVHENGTAEKGIVRKECCISAEDWSRIKAMAAENGLSIFSVQVTLYAMILSRWSGETHFTLNIPIFNRSLFSDDVLHMVGEFGSLILLEIDLLPDAGLVENCRRIQQQFEQDLDHRDAGSVALVDKLAKKDGRSYPIVFTSLSTPDGKGGIYDQDIALRRWRSQSSQVWIDSIVFDKFGGIELAWDCYQNVLDSDVLDDMFAAYQKCYALAADLDSEIYQHIGSAIHGRNYETVLKLNRTAYAYDFNPALLHMGFVKAHEAHADCAAVVTSSRTFTYHEIYCCAVQIAMRLLASGVRAGDHVGIYFEKGWKQVAAALGVLFAQAAYVPLSTQWPAERISGIIDSAKMKGMICDDANRPDCTIPCVGVYEQDCAVEPVDFVLNREQNPSDTAYIIFTSGSTGTPKGVVMQHQATVNTLLTVNRKFGIGASDRTFMLSELNFDLSVYDIFGIFYAGGAVVVPTAKERKEPGCWSKIIEETEVTVWNSVPALMQMVVDIQYTEKQPKNQLKTVMLSGDWIPLYLPEKITAMFEHAAVISLGGATEAAIWSNYYPVDLVEPDWVSIPYGYPLDNQQMYVLDQQLQICPEHTPGFIYIGGKGLAKEYLGDTALTAQKFVTGKNGERLYFTGDKGQYHTDGKIEFLGRVDDQIKINGFRIELGEIETAAMRCSGITNAAAAVVKTGGMKIVLFYTSKSDLQETEINQNLSKHLPSYEMPASIIRIPEIRLTANGKVDRKYLTALAEQQQKQRHNDAASKESMNSNECQISEIFAQILELSDVAAEDDFFDLGGNSITVMRLIAMIRQQFGVELTVTEIFENSSVQALAKAVTHSKTVSIEMEQKLELAERYPLSPSQMGIWFDCLSGKSRENMIVFSMDIHGCLDVARLEHAIRQTIWYYPVIRTVFSVDENYNVYQSIAESIEFSLPVDDICEESAQDEILDLYYDGFKAMDEEFDLTKGNLYRFALVKLAKDSYKLFAVFHHILCDDISIRLFVDRMKAFYHSNETPANMEMGFLHSCAQAPQGLTDAQQDFWKAKEPLLRLGDIAADDNGQKEGGIFRFHLNRAETQQFRKLCTQNQATVSAGFLAFYMRTLAAVTGQDAIAVGIPVSMRGETRSDSFGMYVNMCLTVDAVEAEENISSVIQRMRTNTLRLLSGEELPFSIVADAMKWERTYKKLPFRYTYNYLGGASLEAEESDIFGKIHYLYDPYIHDFGLIVEFTRDGYDCTITGKPGYISADKVAAFTQTLESAIRETLQNSI